MLRGPKTSAVRAGIGALAVSLVAAAGSVCSADPSEWIAHGDAAYAERFVPERMAAAIDAYERTLPEFDALSVQSQSHVLNRLAQLCYESTTLTPGDIPEDRNAFERGKAYGLRSLRLDPEFASREAEGFTAAVALVSDPATLLWTADNWGGLFGFDPLAGMLYLGRVRALYERCLVLDETYWGASAHNALGAMLVVTPTALGGDPDTGLTHLERAVELAPDYLINRVVHAQYWGFTYNFLGKATGVRDAAFVEEQLGLVLDAPIDMWSFWNREAKREARALLKMLQELSP